MCWLLQTATLLFLQLNEEQAIEKYIFKYPICLQRLGNWQAGRSFSLAVKSSLLPEECVVRIGIPACVPSLPESLAWVSISACIPACWLVQVGIPGWRGSGCSV